MEELIKLKNELERTKLELGILYEISNAMRTTLNLDEILYIILTGVTAHIGLGFNRAVLFLVNEKDGLIEGKMGIGPESGDEANRIWKQIETEKKDLDDLINAYEFASNENGLSGSFNSQIQHIKVPINDKNESLLALVAQEGMPLHLTRDTIGQYRHTPILQLLRSEELVLIPLKAKDKINGIIVADNFITNEPINKDDIRMLTMLANQAGLAIENSQLYGQTLMRAHLDSLTDLWNHGYFQYILQNEVEKNKVQQKPLSLLMLDIDDFKVYNDTAGHQAGDKILKELAGLLKTHSRNMDFVCRYGGEEFSIIMPDTDKYEASDLAERLRMDIEKHPFTHEEILPHKKITVSIGVATYPEDGVNPSQLIAFCDKALYKAKSKGKNNICCS